MYTCEACGQSNFLDTVGCGTCYAPPPAVIQNQHQSERHTISVTDNHAGMREEIIHRFYTADGTLAEERIERRSWIAPVIAAPVPALRALSSASFRPLAQPAVPASLSDGTEELKRLLQTIDLAALTPGTK